MSVAASASHKLCRVLEEDRELGESLAPEVREQALKECLAREITIPAGPWSGSQVLASEEGIGLLVLSGLLIRRVGIEARFGAELLGEGDLLRPWQGEDEPPMLPLTTGWQMLEPTRMAVLDDAFARRIARYTSLSGHLVGRAIQRSRNLAVNMAIVHQARVNVRLHMLLWHLAARWGRVRREDISLPLRLTHAVLADLTAARRPTVTSALSELAKRGLVRSVEGGFALTGDPPGELLELAPVPSSFISQRGSVPT